MVSEVISKVFALSYSISEEDYGIIELFSSYELAKKAKQFAVKEALSSPFFIRFRIDVYEVFSSVPEDVIKGFCHPGLNHNTI